MDNKDVKKKRKMNILGYLSIAATFGLMEYVKFQAIPDDPIWKRLLNGVVTYAAIFFAAGLIVLVLWIGMYLANLFFNTIYDENNEPPKWDNADHMIFVFFVVLYIIEITGNHIVL
jgi:hypothetical protein